MMPDDSPGGGPDALDALVGRVLLSGLRVLTRSGNTSLGPLYRAQYPAGPPVALTLLDAPARPRDSSAVSPPSPLLAYQFRRACEIRHPNVANLVEVGETSDGLTYVVGQCFTGELLGDVLAARGALPVEEAVDICLQVAAGLEAAHRIGIVHGGISPRAILIAQSEGNRPLVKLIRFNLDWDAKAGRGRRGTVDDRYSSPERLAGSPPDQVGDVFGLGGVLHTLLTGAAPDDLLARASIPKAQRLVVDRALATAPDRRYPTAAAFAEALEEAGRLGRGPWVLLRHPRLAGAIGAAVLAAVIWLGWSRHWIEGASARTPREIGMRVGDEVGLAPAPSAASDTARPVRGRGRTGSESVRPQVKRRQQQAPSPPVPEAPAKVVPGSTPAAGPVVTAAAEPPRADSGSKVAISPFRRAHPWAALPEGRFYFPSSCPLALRSRELLYFRSEAAARATGRSRSTQPGCS